LASSTREDTGEDLLEAEGVAATSPENMKNNQRIILPVLRRHNRARERKNWVKEYAK
jgi:hypothetical protein